LRNESESRLGRRAFLIACARAALLAGMGALGIALAARSPDRSPGRDCTPGTACDRCARRQSCPDRPRFPAKPGGREETRVHAG